MSNLLLGKCERIDCVLLLVAEGFKGRIFCTAATKELSAILLQDSATIQAHEYNDAHHQPCYTFDDVVCTMDRMEIVHYDQWFEPWPGISALYTPTGHLAGAAAVHLKVCEHGKTTTITYSADAGRARHPLLRPAGSFPQAEYILLESTYGDRHHDLLISNVDVLLDWIKDTCLTKHGRLIIPAFSVGRTQEILFLLYQLQLENRLPELKYFVDSPLAIKATEIIKNHMDEFNEHLQSVLAEGGDPFTFQGLKYVETTEDSIRLTEYKEPCVIIAASGTGDAGRIRHHIASAVEDAANTILFSGYCGPDSTGGQLLGGAKMIEIKGANLEVRARVEQLKGLSAHGDTDDLCQFIACQDPAFVRAIYLVHGDHRAQEKLASRLQAKGFYPVLSPDIHEEIELNRNRHALPAREVHIESNPLPAPVSA